MQDFDRSLSSHGELACSVKEVSFQHESTRGMRLPHSPATSRAFRNPDEAGAPPTNTESASE